MNDRQKYRLCAWARSESERGGGSFLKLMHNLSTADLINLITIKYAWYLDLLCSEVFVCNLLSLFFPHVFERQKVQTKTALENSLLCTWMSCWKLFTRSSFPSLSFLFFHFCLALNSLSSAENDSVYIVPVCVSVSDVCACLCSAGHFFCANWCTSNTPAVLLWSVDAKTNEKH